VKSEDGQGSGVPGTDSKRIGRRRCRRGWWRMARRAVAGIL